HRRGNAVRHANNGPGPARGERPGRVRHRTGLVMPVQASFGRTGVAVSAVVIAALAGCGGGGDYCAAAEGVGDDFKALQQVAQPGDREGIENLASSYSEVADTAPDDVQEQWENLAAAMEVLA